MVTTQQQLQYQANLARQQMCQPIMPQPPVYPTGTELRITTAATTNYAVYADTGTVNGNILVNNLDTGTTNGWATGNRDIIWQGDVTCNNFTILGELDVDLRVRRFNLQVEDSIGYEVETVCRVAPTQFIDHATMTRKQNASKRYGMRQAFSINRETLLDLDTTGAKEYFAELFKHAVVSAGHQIGKEVTKDLAGQHTPFNPEMSRKKYISEVLDKCEIDVPVKDDVMTIKLGDLINRPVLEGGKMTFSYEALRLARICFEKKKYVEKIQSVSIRKKITEAHINLEDARKFWGIKGNDFNRYTEQEIQKELKALVLLRRLVQQEEFTKYMQDKYIDIPALDGSGKIYRVFRDHHLEVMEGGKAKENLCIHLANSKCPKTDEVIMRVLLAKNDPKKLYEGANKYPGGMVYVGRQ